MTRTKNRSSVQKAVKKFTRRNAQGKDREFTTTYYLSNTDIENGVDISLDLQGYTVTVL